MKGLFSIFPMMIALISSSFVVDLSQQNKYANNTIQETPCNKDTQIDFLFSSSTNMKCSSTACTLTKADSSTMKFLDVAGHDLELTLSKAEFTDQSFISGQNSTSSFAFTFVNEDDNKTNKTVYVIVPIIFETSNSNSVITLSSLDDDSIADSFTSFKNIEDVQVNVALSAFNFLNLRDFGHFYHVANSKMTSTVLISAWTYSMPKDFSAQVVPTAVGNMDLDYAETGDKLCYGSLEVELLFQTHMRESVPLWTAWFAIFFFWLYYLLTDTHPIDCYDKRFEENKMTSWGFYSLHYLGHDEYFSKLSRISLMLINFSWQGLVLSGVYMNLGPLNDNLIIIWASFIALAASYPVPFILGGTFLRSIKNTTLEKFRKIKESKGVVLDMEKKGDLESETELDRLQEKLYGLYYWYYVLTFIFFIAFWTLSVHLMQQTHREFYYLHFYWLASLGIVFALEHLILDPILSCILGHKFCYQIRGYYYDFELGKQFKQIEE